MQRALASRGDDSALRSSLLTAMWQLGPVTVPHWLHTLQCAFEQRFLLFPDLEELDLVGPWEMIATWSKYAKGPERYLMIAETEEPVTCSNGMILTPHASFGNAPPLDYLLIPGGFGTRAQVANEHLTEYIASQARHCRAILSVCTGAFILKAMRQHI